jgi:MoaA/NifB/PqqE/SkfB family radical SAM enzyme
MKAIEKGYLVYKKHKKYSNCDNFTLQDKFRVSERHNKLISIVTISNCNLNCSFCRGGINKDLLEEYSKYKIMPTQEFQDIVLRCLESGIQFFDLTPAIGEPFLDKTFINKLEFLENKEEVVEYTFTTNLLVVNVDDIRRISKFKKLVLDVSLYGETEEEYLTNTNKNQYNLFLKKIEMLYEECDKLKIRFIQRCNLSQDTQLYRYLTSFRVNKNANLVVTEKYNLNRAGHIEGSKNKPRTRSGVCPYGPGANGGIVTGGNVLFCSFHDLKREGVMGNIFKTPLNEIYDNEPWQNILNQHKNNNYTGMCENCDETW